MTTGELISKNARWRKLPKLYAKVASEITRQNADKHGVHISKVVYYKSCVNLLWFQNVYRPNREPYSSVLDLTEKSTRYAGVLTKETVSARSSHGVKQIYYHTYLQSLAFFVEQTHIAEIRGKRIPLNLE